MSLTAFSENVSSSRRRNLAVPSNTIIASAKIARLLRNAGGKSTNGSPLYCRCPNSIPTPSSRRTSGSLICLPIQLQISPMNNNTAIDVVICSASIILAVCRRDFIKLSYHSKWFFSSYFLKGYSISLFNVKKFS